MSYDFQRYPVMHAREHSEMVGAIRFLNEQGQDLLRSGSIPSPTTDVSRLFIGVYTRVFMIVDQETREVVACAFIALHPTCRGLVGDIDYVLTHPGHRGNGLGRAIMEELLTWAREYMVFKIYKLRLISEPEREAARALYESLGFKLEDGSDRHYKLALV